MWWWSEPKKKLWRKQLSLFQLARSRDFTTGPHPPLVSRYARANHLHPHVPDRQRRFTRAGGLPGSRTTSVWAFVPGDRGEGQGTFPPSWAHAPTPFEPVRPSAAAKKKIRNKKKVAPTPRGTKKLGTALEEPIDGRDLGARLVMTWYPPLPKCNQGDQIRVARLAPLLKITLLLRHALGRIGESRGEVRKKPKGKKPEREK